jgi:hypothetical protein
MRVLVAALALGLGLAAAPASAHATGCGSLEIRFSSKEADSYPISVTQGAVPCSTARNVLKRFVASGTDAPGWYCVLGHDKQRYSAQCARIKGPAGHVVAGLPLSR